MKKLFFMIAAFAIGFSFYSCKDDNEPSPNSSLTSINVNVENGSSYSSSIDSVYIMIIGKNDSFIIGKSKYQNGNFSIALPRYVDNSYLFKFSKILSTNSNVVMSDENAMTSYALKFVLIKNGEEVGELVQGSQTLTSQTSVQYLYADRAFTVNGDESNTQRYYTRIWDVSFKRGRNTLLIKESETTLTSERTSGSIPSDVKWHIEM